MGEIKPRRGDLLVIEVERHDYYTGQGTQSRTEYEVMEVAGLFRDGQIRTVRNITWGDGGAQQNLGPAGKGRSGIIGLTRHWLVAAADIDKDAVIRAVREHTYPNSDTPMPFKSLAEVRELIKPHRKVVSA